MVPPFPSDRMPVLVIMGVAGSGKSTVAGLLAGRLGWDLAEGDDMHPPANVAKMAAGHALDDEDRWPWLDRVAGWIREHARSGRPGVITCSALKQSYRDILRGDGVVFVFLVGAHDQIAARLAARHGHFMPAAMLDSQIQTLEPPSAEETAIRIDVAASPYVECEQIISQLHLTGLAGSNQTESIRTESIKTKSTQAGSARTGSARTKETAPEETRPKE